MSEKSEHTLVAKTKPKRTSQEKHQNLGCLGALVGVVLFVGGTVTLELTLTDQRPIPTNEEAMRGLRADGFTEAKHIAVDDVTHVEIGALIINGCEFDNVSARMTRQGPDAVDVHDYRQAVGGSGDGKFYQDNTYIIFQSAIEAAQKHELNCSPPAK